MVSDAQVIAAMRALYVGAEALSDAELLAEVGNGVKRIKAALEAAEKAAPPSRVEMSQAAYQAITALPPAADGKPHYRQENIVTGLIIRGQITAPPEASHD